MSDNDLCKRAMLAKVKISCWSARKKDRAITSKVEAEANAQAGVGSYTKTLIPKERMQPLKEVVANIRELHKEYTLPWGEGGSRILPIKVYEVYTSKMQDLVDKFNRESDVFFESYGDMMNEARGILGDMFDSMDYPDNAALSGKFKIKTEIMPIPASNDFRVALRDDIIDSIRKEIEESVVLNQKKAMRDLWNRLYNAVDHIAERMEKDDNNENKRFKRSIFENLSNIVDILPDLNVSDDVALNELCKTVKEKLNNHAVEDIRKDDAVRNTVLSSAKEIMSQMSAFMPVISDEAMNAIGECAPVGVCQ